MNSKKSLPLYSILLTLVLFTFQHLSTLPPVALEIDVSENQFSAERAFETLKVLLKENQPHPVGSPLNKKIKERLIQELKKLEIEYEVQKTWACATRFSTCAEVENLIAIIPGEEELPFLALMAHYDSVPMAPGAGDDGAGVVAILEAARVLKLHAPYKHPIMILLTDAEEVGLIGAEAFFNQHPLAKKVGIVLNVEGSGTSGGSMVFRTSDKNELLLNSLSHNHDDPYGFSLSREIFKRMPNDTDFSVAERANIPGMDFAFVGERNHYHTPNDNVENLDIRAIQHHGENILNASRNLLSADWSEMGEANVYLGTSYGFWSQWKSSYSPYILIFSFLLIMTSIFRSTLDLKNTLLAILLSPLTFITTVLFCFLSFYSLSYFSGNIVSWPGIDWPYRLLLVGSSCLGLIMGSAVSKRYSEDHEMIYGVWIFWSLLALLVTIFLPDAANLFLLPLLFASLIILISTFLEDRHKLVFLLSTLIVALPSTLGLVFALEQSQGYKLVIAVLPFAGLYAMLISPFLLSLNMKNAFLIVGLPTLITFFAGSNLNLYTEERPQHINIHFFENLDVQSSYLHLSGNYKNLAATDPEPLIEPLKSFVDVVSKKDLISFAPEYQFRYWSESKSSGWKGPSISNLGVSQKNSIKVNLKSNRSASRIILLLPQESKLNSFEIGSVERKPSLSNNGYFKGYYVIYLNGIYDKEIDIKLNFEVYEKGIQGYLIDVSTELPKHLTGLYEKRSGIFSPVHRGDQATLIKKIKL